MGFLKRIGYGIRHMNFKASLCIPYALFMILFILAPIVLILFYAFTNSSGQFTFENFQTIFSNSSNFKVIGMSIIVGVLNTLVCLLIGYPIAYFLANSKYNKNKILVYLFLIPMWINFVIRTIATRDMLAWIGISAENHALLSTVIGMVYNYLPFAILPLYNQMLKLDQSQIEAAKDLGANPPQVFFKTILPMTVPGIISAILMTFMPTMSSYVIADKLGGGKVTLIGNLIANQFSSTAQNSYNVGSVLAIIMLLMIGLTTLISSIANDKKPVKRGGLF
ncbi:spermidine/putrescine transport system permease protein [Anaeroplasma bactoclasticum]|jgi:spermidine/putrescine transport system permease protein|uniref:Spermidine/putrescine transport system permease protein n=1 Tax=Anaeroplasma bactoclasticum TaxID=2088 RepID=A0A397RVZ7_9MOLU|nr:ABC transporter permease [Anaeroplasma bactoclasticum]RIA78363.1 spermidine/putrescine transport system permease protein [Anaeroplasma bactoclasticum]